MKNNTLTIVLICIIVAIAAFFGGMKYQQSKSPFGMGAGQFRQRGAQGAMNAGQNGQFRARNGGFGGGTIGKILSIDAETITVQLMDGSSKIVNLSNTTTISKTATASKSDLKVGDTVAAIGAPNADGSVNADRVQLNPPQMNRQSTPSAAPTQ